MELLDTRPVWTAELPAPWLKPPVAKLHLTFRARMRRRKNRFMASAFVADIKGGYRRSLVILGAFGVLFAVLLVFRGLIVAADIAGLLP